MSASASAAQEAPRFIRRTQLGAQEYRTNFRQLDCEVIAALISEEATKVTSQMSKIYLCLINAPVELWERDGVLRFTGCDREGKWQTAWEQLLELAGVASATARKALAWMSEQAIVGYYAGKNGVGIRIFINRASSSIACKPDKPELGQKILHLVQASPGVPHTSPNEAAFNDSFAVLETLETDINSRAPKNGADNKTVDKIASDPTRHTSDNQLSSARPCNTTAQTPSVLALDEIVMRLKAELEPAMQTAARNAAAREHERTREWLEKRGLPKAARVAQHEAYNVLRKYGVISESARNSRAHAEVGRSDYVPPEPHPLTDNEIADLAGACVAMFETKGQSIDLTLSEMSVEAGGYLLPDDAPQVRDHANALLSANNREGK
jgi:CRP-like cAMP-binding protein